MTWWNHGNGLFSKPKYSVFYILYTNFSSRVRPQNTAVHTWTTNHKGLCCFGHLWSSYSWFHVSDVSACQCPWLWLVCRQRRVVVSTWTEKMNKPKNNQSKQLHSPWISAVVAVYFQVMLLCTHTHTPSPSLNKVNVLTFLCLPLNKLRLVLCATPPRVLQSGPLIELSHQKCEVQQEVPFLWRNSVKLLKHKPCMSQRRRVASTRKNESSSSDVQESKTSVNHNYYPYQTLHLDPDPGFFWIWPMRLKLEQALFLHTCK